MDNGGFALKAAIVARDGVTVEATAADAGSFRISSKPCSSGAEFRPRPRQAVPAEATSALQFPIRAIALWKMRTKIGMFSQFVGY